ncbi:hypothetical protein BC830DRAFT_1168349 [Chytriomyces sp. MP71]|nr:hypothetical protein BC830DRAFT_1168349 [Chytriomyces sp. MP71]
MGVKSLWTLVRTLFPNACVKAWNVTSAIRASESSASSVGRLSSRPPLQDTNRKPTPTPKPAKTHAAKTRLYVDVNGLLHRASYRNQSADAVVADVKSRIDALVFSPSSRGAFDPRKGFNRMRSGFDSKGTEGTRFQRQQISALYIALDGPAPLGKLLMQKSRRLSVAKKRRTTTDSLRFNSLNFTPGSLFMTRFDAILSNYAASVVSRDPRIQECVVSGSRVPGEGETKIVEQVYKAASMGANTDLNLIITGDSDALIHLLFLPHTIRAALFTPDQNIVFTVPPLLEHLREHFPQQHTQLYRVAQDMSVLILIGFGNDILPALRGCRFDTMWTAYRTWMADTDGGRFLVHIQHGQLDLDVLKIILERAQVLMNPIKRTTKPPRRKQHPSTNLKSDSDSATTLSEPPSDSDTDAPGSFNSASDSSDPPAQDPDDDTLTAKAASEKKITSYMEMLIWVLHGCSRGATRDFRVVYKEGFAPDPAAVCDWIERRRSTTGAIMNWDDPVVERGALTPALCAVAVIPAEECDILDASLAPLVHEFEAICARNSPPPEPGAEIPTPPLVPLAGAPNKYERFIKSVEELESRFGDDVSVRAGFMSPVRARFMQEGGQEFCATTGVNLVGDVREGLLPIVERGGTLLRYVRDGGKGSAVCFEVWEEGVGWRWVKDAKRGKKEKVKVKVAAHFRLPSGRPYEKPITSG